MDHHPQRRFAACVFACIAVACGAPDLELHVTFEGTVDIEDGAPVMYQGVEIGEVSDISLRQQTQDAPAFVALTLEIETDEITLRQNDRFEIASGGLLKDPVVRVTPSPDASDPIPSGATVRGVPPLITRLGESIDAAVSDLGAVASKKTQEALDAIAESLEGLDFGGGIESEVEDDAAGHDP